MRWTRIGSVAIAACCSLGLGCDEQPSSSGPFADNVEENIAAGVVNGTSYRHDGFGVAAEFPDGWTVVTDAETLLSIFGLGAELISAESSEVGALLEANAPGLNPLVFGSRRPLHEFVEGVNPNINVLVERLMPQARNASAVDYLRFTEQLIKSTGTFEARVVAPKAVDHGGEAWARWVYSGSVIGVPAVFEQRVRVVGGLACVVSVTAGTTDVLEELRPSLDTIRFSPPSADR